MSDWQSILIDSGYPDPLLASYGAVRVAQVMVKRIAELEQISKNQGDRAGEAEMECDKLREEVIMRKAECRDDRKTILRLEEELAEARELGLYWQAEAERLINHGQ
jgi:hypothetical protein